MAGTREQLRGAPLVKKAIELGRGSGEIEGAEPTRKRVIAKLRMPNGEILSTALAELLAVDCTWLGLEPFDEDEPVLPGIGFEDFVEREFGPRGVRAYDEALDKLDGECIPLPRVSPDILRVLYLGKSDELGEYPVVELDRTDGPWIGGFAPLDVWIGQQLGVVAPAKERGWLPPDYAKVADELAKRNGLSRRNFVCDPNWDDDY